MSGPRIRLLVTGLLFFGWLGWLGYLAVAKTHPVVVSRSQAMAATHFVLAEVKTDPATGQPLPEVTVVEDLRPLGQPLERGSTVRVRNIKEARIAGGRDGFQDPGPYLLMLTKSETGYELTPPPRAPGNESPVRPRPWAYVWSAPSVQDQFNELVPVR